MHIETLCERLVRRRSFLQAHAHRTTSERRLSKRYQFRHSLYRDVVSTYIPTTRQRALHLRIGEWKENAYGKQSRVIASALAMHFEHGQDDNRAIRYLRLAGENATRQSAHHEAMSLFTKGLELLQRLPQTPELIQEEIRLHLALGAPLITLKGYASSEVENTYTQARTLCEQIKGTRYLFPAVLGLCGVRHNQAEFRKARLLAQQLLRLARQDNEPTRLLWAQLFSGTVAYLMGKFARAQQHFMAGITLYDPRKHSPHASDVIQDPGVHCRCYVAEVLWLQGYADQARQFCHQALTLARQLGHSHSLAVALSSATLLHNWFGDQQTAQALVEELMTLTEEQGFPQWFAVGTFRQGWTLVKQGRAREGIQQMRQGLVAFQATGAKQWLPFFSAELAWACGEAGDVKEGLALVTEGEGLITQTDERVYEAELYRLRGELTLQKTGTRGWGLGAEEGESQNAKVKMQKSKVGSRNWELGAGPFPSPFPNPQSQILDPHGEAESCFLKAITIAQQQKAKSLELRAVMSLVRLRQQGAACAPHPSTRQQLTDAYTRLGEVYSWFTEGFDTADVREAKALLHAQGD